MAPVASKPVIPPNDNVAHALAGAGGGILSMILTYPLITLSTRAQVESKRADSSFLHAVRHIVEREGLGGLYAGLDSALFGISITNFVYYYWYEWTRAFFEAAALQNAARVSKKLTTVESMIAGAIAGSATVIITNPIWVVNTRMTTRKHQVEEKKSHDVEKGENPEEVLAGPTGADDSTTTSTTNSPSNKRTTKSHASSTLGTLMALLRNEGPKALFSGVLPALVLVINPILQYTLFEQLKNALEKRRRVTPAMAFVLGAVGKLFATSITYPYITVKSQAHVAGRDGKTEGMTAAIRRIVKEEGVSGLYKGIGPKVTQSVLTAAFLFAFKDVLYEQTIRLRQSAARKTLA